MLPGRNIGGCELEMRMKLLTLLATATCLLAAVSSDAATPSPGDDSDAIPYKATITYKGSYNASTVVASRRRGNLPSFRVDTGMGSFDLGRLANSIPRKETKVVSGSIVLIVNFRGNRITGQATTTGEANSFTFTGSRNEDQCAFDDTDGYGSVSRFRCTATEFTGKTVNGASDPQQATLSFDAIVDETAKLRTEADAIENTRRAKQAERDQAAQDAEDARQEKIFNSLPPRKK